MERAGDPTPEAGLAASQKSAWWRLQ